MPAMNLKDQIPESAKGNICLGCVPKDDKGREPYGHNWWFDVCGLCGIYRLCMEAAKLKPQKVQAEGELDLTEQES